jgi:hypothetical protein
MMSMVTRNMNNIENNVITNVANMWNMKDTRERIQKAIPSHALDKIRNPSEACLPLDLTQLVMP